MKKRFLLSLLLLGILHCEIGEAQSTDFPNILDKGGIQVLCKSAVAVSAPADATEDTLATCTVPANAMGANGWLRIYTMWTVTNSANAKTSRIRFSGAAGTVYLGQALASQTQYYDQRVIANRGVANSQIGVNIIANGGFGVLGTAGPTSAVDTTAATTLVITCQKATGSETCTLESFLVELMPSN